MAHGRLGHRGKLWHMEGWVTEERYGTWKVGSQRKAMESNSYLVNEFFLV